MALNTKVENLIQKSNKKSYFRQIQQELKKVSWTPKAELFLSTKIVLISVFVFGLAIYVADVMIRMFFSSISNFAQLITG